MKKTTAALLVAALVGLGGQAIANAQGLDCEVDCPPGTQLAEFGENVFKEIGEGSFLWTEQRCEASCAPIVPCRWPNVPVVSAEAGFSCQPLPGFSTIGPDQDVDLGFVVGFNPALAGLPTGEPDEPSGQLVVLGSAFDEFEGESMVMAAISLDQQRLLAVTEVTIEGGAFFVDFTGQVPRDGVFLAFFFGEGGCQDGTVYQTLSNRSPGGPRSPQRELVWGAIEPFTTNGALCPLIEGGL